LALQFRPLRDDALLAVVILNRAKDPYIARGADAASQYRGPSLRSGWQAVL